MNRTTSFFERLIATVHRQISGDDFTEYNLDFSGFVIPRVPELRDQYHDVAQSLSVLFQSKKLRSFVMFYETVAFCMRFKDDNTLDRVNPRMIAEVVTGLPPCPGNPTFLIGTEEPTIGFGWKQASSDSEGIGAEIYPLLDFPNLCLYYARPLGETRPIASHGSSSSMATWPGGD
jgi:hypothetical protein